MAAKLDTADRSSDPPATVCRRGNILDAGYLLEVDQVIGGDHARSQLHQNVCPASQKSRGSGASCRQSGCLGETRRRMVSHSASLWGFCAGPADRRRACPACRMEIARTAGELQPVNLRQPLWGFDSSKSLCRTQVRDVSTGHQVSGGRSTSFPGNLLAEKSACAELISASG
jgi:hypothetical protein